MNFHGKITELYAYMAFILLLFLLRPIFQSHPTFWIGKKICYLFFRNNYCSVSSYGIILFLFLWPLLAFFVRKQVHIIRFFVVTYVIYVVYYNLYLLWESGHSIFCINELPWFILSLKFMLCMYY
jgi:cobalamin biosynthesis protein CobD/CbiB